MVPRTSGALVVEEVAPANPEEPGDDLFHETSIGRRTIHEAHQITRIMTVGKGVAIAVVEGAEGLPVVLLECSLTFHFALTIRQNQNLYNTRKSITRNLYCRRRKRTT